MESELLFGPRSDEEKQGAFEVSTLELALRQLGYSPAEVRSMRTDVGDPGLWNFEWFNAQGFVPQGYLCAERVFRFDLSEAFFRPTKSELVRTYLSRKDEAPDDLAFCMIFKVAGWGRMVASSPDLVNSATTHINAVAHGTAVRIALFEGFLTPWRRS